MRKINAVTLTFLFTTLLVNAQTEEFKPVGKPVIRIFSNFHTTFSDGESASAFELKRVYLGYEHAFSKNLSGKVVFDVGDPSDKIQIPDGDEIERKANQQMTAYVKNANLEYKAKGFKVNFGLISTTQFKVQEKFWGYRYIEKSFQDAYKFNASADLGVSIAYKFCDFFSADAIIANGEGYKKLESDSTFRTGFGITLNPVKQLSGRVYYDFSTKDNTQSSLAAFVGYNDDYFSLGAEYNNQINSGFKKDHDLSGISFYTTITAIKKVKLIARYDKLFSNTLSGETSDWNLSKDGQLFIAGVEYSPVKGVKLAPNFKGWQPASDSKVSSSTVILNCEIKL